MLKRLVSFLDLKQDCNVIFVPSNIYRIKGILYSIVSLSRLLSGEPDSPLNCLSPMYIQKWLKRCKKDFFAVTEKMSDLNSIYLHAKTILFGDYFFFSVVWFVKRHSVKPPALHFQLIYECDVIFTVPQICAYFVDNPHNLEIDSFKIAVSEHILLYFKNSNSCVFCVHMIMCGTRCKRSKHLK